MSGCFLLEVEEKGQIFQKARKSINADAFGILVVYLLQNLHDRLFRPLQVLLLAEPQEVRLVHVGLLLEIVLLDYFSACVLREDFLHEVQVLPQDHPHWLGVSLLLMLQGQVFAQEHLLLLLAVLEQLLIQLVLLKDDADLDVLLDPLDPFFYVPLLKLLLNFVLEDFLLPFHYLLFSEFLYLLLLFPLFQFGNVGLKLWVYELLSLYRSISRDFLGSKIGLRLPAWRLNVMLFHKVFLVLICILCVFFHLELLAGSVGPPREFRGVGLEGLLGRHFIIVSLPLFEQLIPRLYFRQMEGRLGFRGGIALCLLQILNCLLNGLFYIGEVTQN